MKKFKMPTNETNKPTRRRGAPAGNTYAAKPPETHRPKICISISPETAERKAADESLQMSIGTEAAARESADTALQAAIDAEVEQRHTDYVALSIQTSQTISELSSNAVLRSPDKEQYISKTAIFLDGIQTSLISGYNANGELCLGDMVNLDSWLKVDTVYENGTALSEKYASIDSIPDAYTKTETDSLIAALEAAASGTE